VACAGLGRKQCGTGAGWEGARGGLEVCRCGAGSGKISQIPTGAGPI